jgi:hypothetical protein
MSDPNETTDLGNSRIIDDTLDVEDPGPSKKFKTPDLPQASLKKKGPGRPPGQSRSKTDVSESEIEDIELTKLVKKIAELSKENKNQSNLITSLSEQIGVMSTKMNEMERRIQLLEKEKDDKKTEETRIPWSSVVSKWASSEANEKKPQEQQILLTNSILKENLEREAKKQNVIVFGVKTSNSDIGVNQNGIKTFWRFKQKQDSNKYPPILIKLNDNVNRVDVLVASKKLSKSNEYKNVFVNLDLTVYQREEERKLRIERNALNKKETDEKKPFRWGIRYRSSGERLVRYKIDGGNN